MLFSIISCQKSFDNKPVYKDFKTDLEASHFYGNIKKIVSRAAYYQYGSENKFEDSKLTSSYTFNNKGNYETIENYSVFEKLENKSEYVYTDKNLVKELKVTSHNGDEFIQMLQHYSYNTDSLLMYLKVLKNNAPYYDIYTEYDENQNFSKMIKIHENDTTVVTYKNTYDKENRIIKTEEIESDEIETSVYTYTYNDLGNQIANTMDLYSFAVRSEYVYEGALLITITSYEKLGSGKEEINNYVKYDQYGNVILFKRYEDGRLTSIHKNDYEFDSTGNWIKRTEYINSNPSKENTFKLHLLETREITYWK